MKPRLVCGDLSPGIVPPTSQVFLLIILCDLKISKQMMVFKADYLCIDPQTYGLELQVCQAQV